MKGALTEVSGKEWVRAIVVKPGIRPVGAELSDVVGFKGVSFESDSIMDWPCALWPDILSVRVVGGGDWGWEVPVMILLVFGIGVVGVGWDARSVILFWYLVCRC